MGTLNLRIKPLGFAYGAPCHFMRHSTSEKYEQVGRAYLLFQIGFHMGENFRIAFIFLTYFLVFSYHAVVAAYYNYAHG